MMGTAIMDTAPALAAKVVLTVVKVRGVAKGKGTIMPTITAVVTVALSLTFEMSILKIHALFTEDTDTFVEVALLTQGIPAIMVAVEAVGIKVAVEAEEAMEDVEVTNTKEVLAILMMPMPLMEVVVEEEMQAVVPALLAVEVEATKEVVHPMLLLILMDWRSMQLTTNKKMRSL